MRTLLAVLILFLGAGLRAQGYDHFVREYEAAEKTGEASLMQKTIKTQTNEAIPYFSELVKFYQFKHVDTLRARIETFKENFKAVYPDAELLVKIEEFYTNLEADKRTPLAALESGFNQLYNIYQTATTSRKEDDFRKALAFAEDYMTKLEQVGHMLKAAESAAMGARITNEMPNRTKDDEKKGVALLEKFKEFRTKWGWTKDKDFLTNSNFLESQKKKLEAGDVAAKKAAENEGAAAAGAGTGGDDAPEEESGTPRTPGTLAPPKLMKGAKWERVPLNYQTEETESEGLTVYSGSYPIAWLGAYIEGDAPYKFNFFKDGELFMHRPAANKFVIADNEKGDDGEALKIKGKPTRNDFHYKKGDKKAPYALWLWVGSDQQTHQRLSMNIAPEWGQKKRASVFYKSAAEYAATIGDQKIVIHDENTTGILGDEPESMSLKDLRLGGTTEIDKAPGHPTLDSMTIGSNKTRLPFSNYVKIGAQWFKMKVNNKNEELAYRPLDPASFDTGTLVVKWNGPPTAKPRTLVVREVGYFKGAYFELMSSPKGIEVPCGSYEVFYGRVINGKDDRAQTAIVLKGGAEPVKVEMKKTTTLTLGAPFKIDFDAKKEGDKYTMNSTTAWVRGVAGEKYAYLNDEILEPEAVAARDNTGKGAKTVGKFRRISSTDELEKVGKKYSGMNVFIAPFFPIEEKSASEPSYEISFTAPFGAGQQVFTAFRQKGHKMFGDLLPLWK